MLEVAARPIGGLCARVLPGLEELILSHAAGEDVTTIQMPEDAAGVMMIPIPRRGHLRRVEGEELARAVPLIEDVRITARQDQLLEPLPEATSSSWTPEASLPSARVCAWNSRCCFALFPGAASF